MASLEGISRNLPRAEGEVFSSKVSSLNVGVGSDPADPVINDLNKKINQIEADLKTLFQDMQKYHIRSAADLQAHDAVLLAQINTLVQGLQTDLYGTGSASDPSKGSAAWYAEDDRSGNPRSIEAFNLFTNNETFSDLIGVISADPGQGSMFDNSDSVGDMASYIFSLTDAGAQPPSILSQFQNYTGQ